MDAWRIVHDYRRLAKSGAVEFIKCPDCDMAMISSIGENDKPIYVCYACNSKIIPGIDMLTQMKRLVEDYGQSSLDRV